MTKQKNIIIMMLAFLMLLPLGSAAQEVEIGRAHV